MPGSTLRKHLLCANQSWLKPYYVEIFLRMSSYDRAEGAQLGAWFHAESAPTMC